MGKNSRLGNITWFVNPWFDIIFLAAFPLGLMVTALPLLSFPSHFRPFILYAETLTNFPHMLAGLTVVYVGHDEWKKKPVSFIVIPLILFIAVIIFSVFGYFKHIFMIRAIWGSYHIFSQNYFILGIHKSLNNDFHKVDKILDAAVLLVATFLSSYWVFIHKRISDFLTVLAWIIVTAFIARQISLFIRRNQVSLFFKTSMVSSFASAFYYPIIITKNVFATIRAGITTHDVQYLAWCWLYYRRRFKSGVSRETKDFAFFPQPIPYILFFTIIGFLCFLHVRITMASPTPQGSFFIGVFYSAFAYVHFFLDPHAWKVARGHAMLSAQKPGK